MKSAEIFVYSVLALLTGLLLGAAALNSIEQEAASDFDFLYQDFTIDSCLSSLGFASAPLRAPQPILEAEQTLRLCYGKLYLQGQLNEFQVRRFGFQSQHVASRIILWLVVLLTFSGVALAALQLYWSSKILRPHSVDSASPQSDPPNSTPSDTTFTIEQGKIYFRSSVAGLVILAISFAFFFTYVNFVYRIFEVVPEGQSQSSPDQFDKTGLENTEQTDEGSLGPQVAP